MGDILKHYGIKGMHWGVRRYQNPDGSLTELGQYRYRAQKAAKTKADMDKLIRSNLSWKAIPKSSTKNQNFFILYYEHMLVFWKGERMGDFENKIVCGQPMTRWIASWVHTAVLVKKGSELKYDFWKGFRKYLIEKGFTEQEAAECMFIATNGKVEIQDDMKRYMVK